MNSMKLAALLAALIATAASGQPNASPPVETLEMTITLMPEGATRVDALTRIIELPASVSESARENAARGLEQANEARQRRATGLDTAAEAGAQGRERAQQAREDMGRGASGLAGPPGPPELPELPPNLPDGPPGGGPENTGLPENPGPPENIGPPGN